MRPNKDHRTEIILYGLLLIPLLFAAAALAQATEQAQGLAEITAVLSEILHTPSMLRWCASTPKFLLAVLVLYPLAVYCYTTSMRVVRILTMCWMFSYARTAGGQNLSSPTY